MSVVGCRGNYSCQKQYGKGNSSSSQHLQSSSYTFSTFTALQNTDIWNKPACLPLVWFESSSHSAAAPLTEQWRSQIMEVLLSCLTGLQQLLSPYKSLNYRLPFYTPLQAHHPPRCENAMVSAVLLTLPWPSGRRSLSCHKAALLENQGFQRIHNKSGTFER